MAEMGSSSTGGLAPGKTDDAETFAESDLSLTHDKTQVSGGSVQLGLLQSTATRDGDDATLTDTTDERHGVVINPNDSLEKIDVEISANTSSTDCNVRLSDSSGNTMEYERQGVSAGDVITLVPNDPLQSGTNYHVTIDGIDSTDAGYYSNISFPYESSRVDITDGIYAGSTDNDPFCFVSITGYTDATSGTTYVEWGRPDDFRSWDQAILTKTPDSETVDVYIEENDGSGWTEIAGPIATGDDIPAKTSNQVRYRVELGRTNTSNNPRLESIYRRYII